MTKEQLETNLAALKLLVRETNDKTTHYKNQLAEVEKQLEDYNKPELTPAQLDEIQCAIESGVENFDFSDSDNYDKEYELDYDGRVNLASLEFNNSYELIEMIVNKVHNLFKEAECPEELDTTEADNHPVQ